LLLNCFPRPRRTSSTSTTGTIYIAPETVKRFEDFCKCEVIQTYYSDNEELLTKLGGREREGYDILVPTRTPSRR
jgi:spermidine/putrescine-binding protein